MIRPLDREALRRQVFEREAIPIRQHRYRPAATDAGMLLSPGFLGLTPVVPADFVLGAASSAVNAGAAVLVLSGFFRHERPQGGAVHIGAVEGP